MILFQDKTQFILLPTFGFVRLESGIYVTVAFLFFGLSFKLFSFPDA